MEKDLAGFRILVVDDEESIRDILGAAFTMQGAVITACADGIAGLDAVRENHFDLVVSDIMMPRLDGLEFMAKVKEEQPWLEFLLITALGNTETVVKAMKLGAGDFVNKPFDIAHVRRVAAGLLARRNRRASTAMEIQGPIGRSAAFGRARELALKAARVDSTVLITGESGTGKEVMARFLHQSGARSGGPFIPVNCGAIPEALMESELFGFEKGAFTGALQEKPGKIELAAGGTLFLDEIAEMPLNLQVKLLRVLQERSVDRLGSRQSRNVDFRLVAATHRDLSAMIREGKFREDLYYRINVIPISLPPLRERGEDLVELAHYFLAKLNERLTTRFILDSEHLQALCAYRWPGNIRELENVLERSVVLSENGRLQLYLPAGESTGLVPSDDLQASRQNAEKVSILKALETCQGNKSHAAKLLGISRRSLLYKVKALEITV